MLLTRDGRRAWLRATPPHIALARDELLGALTEQQLIALADLLEPVIARLDPERELGRVRPADSASHPAG